ncbi:MAG TPA: hypothetical protein VFY93_09820 [Planctomycetota bacterium]|nr:hypothetical protein [Planctomycetota bacterium]
MRRLAMLLLPLALACESTKDRVNKDDPNAEITIKPDELEPMANFVLETNRLLVADFVKVQCSAQFFEQQMGYTRDPDLVLRTPVEILPDGTRVVILKSIHGQETNIDPDTLPRVKFGSSGLEVRAYRELRIYMKQARDRDKPLFLTVQAKSDHQDAKLWVSGRLQTEKPSILIESALLWSKEKERYVHKSAVD